MPDLDRDTFIKLLEKLGDEDDQAVLASARRVSAFMKASDLSWDEMIVDDHHDDDHDDLDDDHVDLDDDHVDLDDDDQDAPAPGDGPSGGPSDGPSDGGKDLALINRILRDIKVSDDTRDDLEAMREDIAEGDFTPADRRYLKALHKRLKR